jgi:pimeloyl-ACP methyl ester carboxylesterase
MKFVVITVLFLLVLLALSFIVTQLLAFYARRKLPAEGQFTEVNGGKIHWTEQGEGETIILIHGLGGNHHNFNYMVSELSRKYHVVSIDRLGSAWSTREDFSYATLDAQADTIVDFINKQNFERPLLVGHSLGGAFSLSIGIRHPDKIRGLALICPASMAIENTPDIFRDLEIRSSGGRLFLANFLSGPFGLLKQKRFLTEVFKPEPITHDFDIKGGAILSRLPSQFQTTCEDLIAAKASQNDVVLKLPQLNVPTHVIFGEDDVILDAQKHGVAFSQATGAGLVMIPKTGHMLPVTQPKLCNKFIEDVMSATKVIR